VKTLTICPLERELQLVDLAPLLKAPTKRLEHFLGAIAKATAGTSLATSPPDQDIEQQR
jgi:hypothetical protein